MYSLASSNLGINRLFIKEFIEMVYEVKSLGPEMLIHFLNEIVKLPLSIMVPRTHSVNKGGSFIFPEIFVRVI